VAGFVINQSGKLMLGKYLPLDQFGVYNIGYFLASFPLLLGMVLVNRMLIPIYREWPPKDNAVNFAYLRKMRFMVSLALMALVAIIGIGGVWIVDLLYDERYAQAGSITVMVALMQIPFLIVLTYDQAALAAGDSKRFFVLAGSKAALMVLCLFVGLQVDGLSGAIIGQGAAMVLAYPVVVWLSKHTGAWDALHDSAMALLGLVLAIVCYWFNRGEIDALIAIGS